MDLLKYNKYSNTSDFLDIIYSDLLLPHIASLTRVTVKSRTTLDNIFTSNYHSSFTLGNLVITLSDHHAQFLLMISQTREIYSEKKQP